MAIPSPPPPLLPHTPSCPPGSATRLVPRFAPLPRTYSGVIRLGVSTTTYDASGEVVEEMPWQHVSDDDLRAAADSMTGEVIQVCVGPRRRGGAGAEGGWAWRGVPEWEVVGGTPWHIVANDV